MKCLIYFKTFFQYVLILSVGLLFSCLNKVTVTNIPARSAPTVSIVGFNTGSLTGGTVVTISGSGFVSGATVDFGGSA